MRQIFNFGKANRLALVRVVEDDDWDTQIGWWLSGRVLGKYISALLPWRKRQGAERAKHPTAEAAPSGSRR